MKLRKNIILILLIVLIAPLFCACTLFNIDTNSLIEELEKQANYDGTYIPTQYFENLEEKQITSSTQFTNYIYKIDGNSLLVFDNETQVKSYEIESCICGDINIKDQTNIFAKIDDLGKLTITKICEDNTIRMICEKSQTIPQTILGHYSYYSFKRSSDTIYTQPNNLEYPEANSYFELSCLSFTILEDNKIEIYNNDTLSKTLQFIYTDTNKVISSDYHFTLASDTLILSYKINSEIIVEICYKK